MIALAVFDLDGTIADTLADIGGAMNTILARYGFPGHPIAGYKKFVGEGVRQLVVKALPPSVDEETVITVEKAYLAHYTDHFHVHARPYDGMNEMLNRLAEAGVAIAILSNKNDAIVKKLVPALYPGRLFADMLGACEAFTRKPSPEGLLYLMSRLSVKPSQTVMIGDSRNDILAGKNAAAKTIGVAWGYGDLAELTDENADFIAHTPETVAQWILDQAMSRSFSTTAAK